MIGHNGDRKTLTTSEMIELASLDALGLLDEQERKDFETAFEAAPEAVRAQLRREQRRFTEVEEILPEVAPPEGLRARVIAAVREAFGAPVESERAVVATLAPRAWTLRGNVTPLWRAACIGFATATVVLLSVGYHMQSQYRQAYEAFRNGELAGEITKSLGPRFVNVLLNPSSQFVTFSDESSPKGANLGVESSAGEALVIINPAEKVGILVCKGLEKLDGEYRLVLVDDAGAMRETLARFSTKGELINAPLLGVNLEGGSRLAIVAPQPDGQPGEAVLSSARL